MSDSVEPISQSGDTMNQTIASKQWFDFDLNKMGKEVMETVIGGNTYQHSKVNQWSNAIVEQVLQQLIKGRKEAKYVVTCAIIQKNGAGVNTATSCFWDTQTDAHFIIRWENKSLHSIVQIFAIEV